MTYEAAAAQTSCAEGVHSAAGSALNEELVRCATLTLAERAAIGRVMEQATALGIRNAVLNQPVEVSAQRPPFAAALGLAGQQPDLVLRFGCGPVLRRSLHRLVQAVLV